MAGRNGGRAVSWPLLLCTVGVTAIALVAMYVGTSAWCRLVDRRCRLVDRMKRTEIDAVLAARDSRLRAEKKP